MAVVERKLSILKKKYYMRLLENWQLLERKIRRISYAYFGNIKYLLIVC